MVEPPAVTRLRGGLHQTAEVICQDRGVDIIDAPTILKQANIRTVAGDVTYLNLDHNCIGDKSLQGICRYDSFSCVCLSL